MGLILRLQNKNAPIRCHYTMVSQIHSQIKYEMRKLVNMERSFQCNRCVEFADTCIGVLHLPNLALAALFLQHVANKHADHLDLLCKVCNHGSLPPRKWIKIGEDIIFIVFIVKGHRCWNVAFHFSVPKGHVHLFPFCCRYCCL